LSDNHDFYQSDFEWRTISAIDRAHFIAVLEELERDDAEDSCAG